MAVAISRTADPASVSSGGSVLTYSSISIGTASADRIVALCVTTIGSSRTILSSTIDYGSGDTSMNATAVAGTSTKSCIFYLAAPSGTTATFKITLGSSALASQNHIVVYSVTGAATTLNGSGIDTSADSAGDPLTTGSITVPSSGGFLASGLIGTSSSFTWSNASEDTDAVNTSYTYSTATRISSGTVTVTATGTASAVAAAMAWVIFDPGVSIVIAQASLQGDSSLTCNASVTLQSSALFSGAGRIAASVGQVFANATLAGSGLISAVSKSGNAASARVAGEGGLAVTTLQKLAANITLAGMGSLFADATRIFVPPPPDFSLHVGIWPLLLPQCPILNGFSEQRQRNAIEFQPELGFTKLRRRASASVMLTAVTFRMTKSQLDTFNDWFVNYQDDGTIAFTWDHPITKVNYSWQFDPKDAPRIDRMTPSTFRVSFNLFRVS